MTYAISDIPAVMGGVLSFSKKIGFSEDGTLYILGDIWGRGAKSLWRSITTS